MRNKPATFLVLCLAFLACASGRAEHPAESTRLALEPAIARVKPALVRIRIVSTRYRDGRELRYESSGSGVIITPEGHVVTNHHVAGQAARLTCTLADRREMDAVLVGTDPLTDTAVIKLQPETPEAFPAAEFGDSSLLRVGDTVLAMGSPMALSQSVTLGIVSNTELVIPRWLGGGGLFLEDGEDVGAHVRWIGHDAAIYSGNSGGPLVDLEGRIVGINEIRIGLGGAIPGNLARDIAFELIERGEVRRSWFGISVQPRLESSTVGTGVLVGSVVADSPAAEAGLKPGDIIARVDGETIDIRFEEELADFRGMLGAFPEGKPVRFVLLREGREQSVKVRPVRREEMLPGQEELRQWGATARDLSFLLARHLKRDTTDGVLVTSVRPGGPASDAKPSLNRDDVIVKANGRPVRNLKDLRDVTVEATKDADAPVSVLVEFERQTQHLLTVVDVGIREIEDPGLEVSRAWLPVETQVLARNLANALGRPDLTGFRVTQVYRGTTAEEAGLEVGDIIVEVDNERMRASAPEDAEELAAWIRQYRIGASAELTVLRDDKTRKIPVELVRSPRHPREMKRYRDNNFDFTARDITFFDRAQAKWEEDQSGVLIERVESGGWAAVGLLQSGDLLLEVNGEAINDVTSLGERMDRVAEQQPRAVVFLVLRGIDTMFLEIQPRWNDGLTPGKE